jgi:regulator of sigma E protease
VPDSDDLKSLKERIARREGVGAEKDYFYFKPLWQRALIVAAGPGINFIFSIIVFAIMFACVGENVLTMQVMTVVPSSAAAAAGVMPGDKIIGVDGHPIDRYEDLQTYVQARPGVPMQLSVTRAGRDMNIPITPRLTLEPSPAGGKVKVALLGVEGQPGRRYYNPLQAVGRGAFVTWDIVAKTTEYLGRLITGKADWQLQGFLGAAHMTGSLTKATIADSQSAHANVPLALVSELAGIAAVLSTSIGLVNLLPIPVLDGGHLLFYAYEAVARRPLPVSAQAAGYRVGLALLVGLMLFTAWNDLEHMQLFHFLGALFS